VNNEYRLLKDLWCNVMGTTIDTTTFVGLDFDDPALDMRRIAEGFGARVERIDDLRSVGGILDRALGHRGPSFLIIGREP
jgi:benzoylformate decarboxylase